MRNSILVVDDDRRLRELLIQFLCENGFQTQGASSAAEARACLATNGYNLMILDIMMPGEDGLQLTQSLRQTKDIPILLLTAREQVDDRIIGLDVGADDYMTKPFDPRELLARIRAILRRRPNPTLMKQAILQLGDFSFDRDQGILTKDGEVVFLTSTELTLLNILAQSPNQAFARSDLAQRIGHRVSERTIDVQITRLRRKIGDDPRQPRHLQTVRHVGYTLKVD